MIETEQQRRWWFATHPEYSSSRTGLRTNGRSGGNAEFDARTAAEWLEELRRRDLPLEADPHTSLDLMPFRRLVTSPAGFLKNLLGNRARGVILNAAEKAEEAGPGKWVETARRGGPSLYHQSKLSGQPIRRSRDTHYIREYEHNGVKFDDYKDGKFYEYKGAHEHLFDRNDEFHPWVKDPGKARRQAVQQAKAAGGIPVIWKVGIHQVKAFEKALRGIEGISVEP